MPISLTLEFPRHIPVAESAELATTPGFVEAMHHAPSGQVFAVTSQGDLWTFARAPDGAWQKSHTLTLDGRLTGIAPMASKSSDLLIWGRDGFLERVSPESETPDSPNPDAQRRRHLVAHTDHVFAAAELAGRVISGGHDAQLRVWDADTGHLHFEAPAVDAAIVDLAFIKPSQAAVVVSRKRVEIWDLDAQKRVTKVATRLSPESILVDPAGRWYAVHGGQRVEVFNARTHARMHNIKPRLGALSCLAMHANGVVLAGSEDGRWAQIDPTSGERLSTGRAHDKAILGMASLPGAVLSWSLDQSVSVSDLASGSVYARHMDHTNMVACGAVVDGGVLTGSADGAVRFWTAKGGSIAALTSAGHTALVREARFLDDDRVLSVASDGVRIWDLQTGAVEAFRDQADSARALVTADRVVAGAHSNLVQVWDRSNGKTLRRFGYAGARFALGDPRGGQVVTGVGNDVIAHRMRPPWGTPWQVTPFDTCAMGVEISPDGRLGIARDENANAVIFDPRTGALGQRLVDAKEMRWLDDRRVLIDDREGCALWVGDPETLQGKSSPLPAGVTADAFVVDDAVVGMTRAGRLVVWDATWTATADDPEMPSVRELIQVDGRLLAPAEDGTFAVTVDGGGLKLDRLCDHAVDERLVRHPDLDDVWVVLRRKTFVVHHGRQTRVNGLSGRPGGRDWALSLCDAIFSGDVLLIGTGQGDVEVWRWRTGERETIQRSLDSTLTFARAESGNVAASSLDSRMAVFGPDGALLTTYGGHGAMVMALLMYQPVDGAETLISAGFDGLILGWDVDGDCRRWTIRTGDVHGMALLGPHHLVVGTQEGEAEVWDLRDRERVASVPMGSLVRETLRAPTKDQVASISQDGRVVIWALDDGEVEVHSDVSVSERVVEMRGTAWHPESKGLAVLFDGYLATLEGETLTPRMHWRRQTLRRVAWSGDASQLFVGMYGGAVFAVPADHGCADDEWTVPEALLMMPDGVQQLEGRDDRLLVADASGAVRVYRIEG